MKGNLLLNRGRLLAVVVAGLILCPFAGLAADPMPPAGQYSYPITDRAENVLDKVYAQVLGGSVPVYATPEDEAAGIPPVRFMPKGYVWVSLEDPEPQTINGQAWYRINDQEYLRAEFLQIATPSPFHGVLVDETFDFPFAWMLFRTRVSGEPGGPPLDNGLELPDRSLVFVYEIREKDGRKWCKISGDWWVPYRRLGLVQQESRPEGIRATERWLDVNLTEQTVAAYEGDRMVYSTLMSSGDSRFPTMHGLFWVRLKVRSKKMRGGESESDYYNLEDVPWQMFFYQGYGLHASYWHDLFGLSSSHGCVNLSPKDAKWFFEWAGPRLKESRNWTESTRRNPGTKIWVHE